MKKIVRLLLPLSVLLLPHVAFAWSADGHKLVCGLAMTYLSDDARDFVKETLAMGQDLDGNGSNDFAAACVWADKSRFEDYKGTYEQHFINIPKAAKTINFARDCEAMDCIAVGIQRSLVHLSRPADGKRERARKAAALRFLGHFIGDLHQPLHVSHGEDWGGNKITVTWYGEPSNLHAVWDSGILTKAGVSYPEGLKLLGTIEPQLGSGNVLEWMRESFKLARSHAYADVSGKPVETGANLDEAYFERSRPVVTQQLVKAAVRLAYLLEGLARGTAETNILIE